MAQGIFLDEFLGIWLLVAFPSSVSVIQGISRGVVSEFQRLESPLPKGILLRKPHVLGLLAQLTRTCFGSHWAMGFYSGQN